MSQEIGKIEIHTSCSGNVGRSHQKIRRAGDGSDVDSFSMILGVWGFRKEAWGWSSIKY